MTSRCYKHAPCTVGSPYILTSPLPESVQCSLLITGASGAMPRVHSGWLSRASVGLRACPDSPHTWHTYGILETEILGGSPLSTMPTLTLCPPGIQHPKLSRFKRRTGVESPNARPASWVSRLPGNSQNLDLANTGKQTTWPGTGCVLVVSTTPPSLALQ